MASMRFPRSNLSGTEAGEGEQRRREAARDQAHAVDFAGRIVSLRGNEHSYMKPREGDVFPNFGGSEGEFARPGWQDYFFLAPNVRFTRTPDREVKKIRPEDAEHAVEEGAQPAEAPALPDSSMAAPAAIAPMLDASPARPSLDRVVESAQVLATEPRPAPTAHAMATARAAAAAPRPATARQPAPVAARPAVTDTRWSFLSDHAYFEFGAPYVVEVRPAEARRVPAPATPPAARRPEPRPVAGPEITALYRVIERPSPAQGARAASLAPVAAPVIAPAAVEPAPAAPAPEPVAAAAEPVEAMPAEAKAPAPRVAANDAVPAARSVEITMPAQRQAPALPIAGKLAAVASGEDYELPSQELLQLPPEGQGFYMSQERLEQNADLLESVLEDFGVKGEIIHVRPGPVVTLYEFEPAPGVKSSRVIGLADDIARSMSAISARVAVIPGRNVIGIELPNETRETVYFRELIESDGFRNTSCKLALCLGKTIGGEPVIAELAKMPHLLVAGTTGSGKSVAINTMILSLLYRLRPEECRLIMVDPKMLELSIYDGIPHLLTPVVTDPKKAVTALKWAVREMEDRYRKMARLGVRNIDGYNQRAAAARDNGETVVMQVQTGFEKGTGEPLFEEQEIDLAPMPYIVVIVDEMADLMMVAGKEIEGAIQRLAQMARAAGIHLIMATQRPSVDVITGTIKANFPTRISFQVTSKIDSRTILGEQGAEQLLGQGDMLHMAGGGRIARVHGPFVSDAEVEHVVTHLKAQGRPEYLETVTADEDDEEEEADQGPVFDKGSVAAEDGDNIYDEAVKVVLRDKKCSTSYIQRRLGIGYNRAASLVERMEKDGIVGTPNHVGKREILLGKRDQSAGRDDND
ncbi:DNA translocase FtsK [Mesorhizobium sp. CC13]|uniref:DNA translocase FtsK n=1 Tax=Mesorhizobium sp. CC13 TaxID=3029194 RepID=UPI0032635DCD